MSLFCGRKGVPCKAEDGVFTLLVNFVKLIRFQQKLFLSVGCASVEICLPNGHEYHILGLLLLLHYLHARPTISHCLRLHVLLS